MIIKARATSHVVAIAIHMYICFRIYIYIYTLYIHIMRINYTEILPKLTTSDNNLQHMHSVQPKDAPILATPLAGRMHGQPQKQSFMMLHDYTRSCSGKQNKVKQLVSSILAEPGSGTSSIGFGLPRR